MANPEEGGAFSLVQLKDAVPAQIGAWKQTRIDVPLQRRATPENKVVYTFVQGHQTATLTIADLGAINSAPGPSHWAGPPNRRETADGAEFVYREDAHTAREIERRQPPAREVVLLLANGIQLSAAGDADMPALKALAHGPVAAAAALVRSAR